VTQFVCLSARARKHGRSYLFIGVNTSGVPVSGSLKIRHGQPPGCCCHENHTRKGIHKHCPGRKPLQITRITYKCALALENRGVEDYRLGLAVQSAQGDPTRSTTGVIRPPSHALLGTKCCERREDVGWFRNRLNLGSSIAGHQTNRRMLNCGLTGPFAC